MEVAPLNSKVEPLPNAQCPMPNAQCPLKVTNYYGFLLEFCTKIFNQ
ncbi:hypothetical protein [Nostoc sp.]|nr:hypothetical protein [Nostoc sp. S13]